MDDAVWQGVRVGLILLLVVLSAMFSGLTLGLMGLDKNNLQCVPAPRPPARRRRPMAGAETNGGLGWARPGPAASGPASADGRPTPSPRLTSPTNQPAGC